MSQPEDGVLVPYPRVDRFPGTYWRDIYFSELNTTTMKRIKKKAFRSANAAEQSYQIGAGFK